MINIYFDKSFLWFVLLQLQQSIGEIRLNNEHTIINGKLFVNRNLVAENILAFNNTLHFISQEHIYIESRNAIDTKPGSIHIGKYLIIE